MATTKAKIAEQAMRILSGGHLKPDRNLDEREVILYVDQVRDELCRQAIFNNIKNGDYDIDSDWINHYIDNEIFEDTELGLKYTDLPANRISLPKDMGIYQVSPMLNQQDAYIPLKPGQLWMYKNTATLGNELNTYYWPAFRRIYFYNLDDAVTHVLILLVAASSQLTKDAVYTIPPDYEKIIVDAVVERFGTAKQIPHDELEDGNK